MIKITLSEVIITWYNSWISTNLVGLEEDTTLLALLFLLFTLLGIILLIVNLHSQSKAMKMIGLRAAPIRNTNCEVA